MRARLPAVMAPALAGHPQIIRKRNGEEVIVLSRPDYERLRPSLKIFLLMSAGAAGDDDDAELEAAIREVRATGTMGLTPRGPVEGG
jgi:8-oxo-dGTP pyrophosphatase MutT (NUDIX family)